MVSAGDSEPGGSRQAPAVIIEPTKASENYSQADFDEVALEKLPDWDNYVFESYDADSISRQILNRQVVDRNEMPKALYRLMIDEVDQNIYSLKRKAPGLPIVDRLGNLVGNGQLAEDYIRDLERGPEDPANAENYEKAIDALVNMQFHLSSTELRRLRAVAWICRGNFEDMLETDASLAFIPLEMPYRVFEGISDRKRELDSDLNKKRIFLEGRRPQIIEREVAPAGVAPMVGQPGPSGVKPSLLTRPVHSLAGRPGGFSKPDIDSERERMRQGLPKVDPPRIDPVREAPAPPRQNRSPEREDDGFDRYYERDNRGYQSDPDVRHGGRGRGQGPRGGRYDNRGPPRNNDYQRDYQDNRDQRPHYDRGYQGNANYRGNYNYNRGGHDGRFYQQREDRYGDGNYNRNPFGQQDARNNDPYGGMEMEMNDFPMGMIGPRLVVMTHGDQVEINSQDAEKGRVSPRKTGKRPQREESSLPDKEGVCVKY